MPLAADNSRFMQSFSHKAEVARAQLAKACSAAAQIVRTVGKPKRIARHSWGALATSVERDAAWPEDGKKVWHGWESESLPMHLPTFRTCSFWVPGTITLKPL